METKHKPVGVLGAGSFGVVVSNLLAKNRKVLLFSRRIEVVETIKKEGAIRNMKMDANIEPTTDLKYIADNCTLLFPVVRSANFRSMMRDLAPLIGPDHIIIHGTKGLDVIRDENQGEDIQKLKRSQIKTMSEVIAEESVVKRIGCFAGPNLAKEIAEGQLAGTVLASQFDEVLIEGKAALESDKFKVFESPNITGVELTGALKNVMAIASGIVTGLGYGENARAMLISRGLAEMTWIGKALGAEPTAFLGLAGVGDLVATCSSKHSRNFSVGFRIAKGEKLSNILNDMNDVVEGIDTIKTVNALTNFYKIGAPISQTLYKVLFENLSIKEGLGYLMNYRASKDVGFI